MNSLYLQDVARHASREAEQYYKRSQTLLESLETHAVAELSAKHEAACRQEIIETRHNYLSLRLGCALADRYIPAVASDFPSLEEALPALEQEMQTISYELWSIAEEVWENEKECLKEKIDPTYLPSISDTIRSARQWVQSLPKQFELNLD